MVSYQSRVNQKLAFVRVSLELYPTVSGNNAKLQQDALLQGSCFHLYAAYLTYLKEVAQTYQAAEVEAIDSVDGLNRALAEVGKTPAEAKELMQLLGAKGSWLNSLIEAHGRCLGGLEVASPATGSNDSIAVPVIALTAEGDSRCNLVNVKAWHQELSSLIARHRESMVEW